jgi:hypothetical protein
MDGTTVADAGVVADVVKTIIPKTTRCCRCYTFRKTTATTLLSSQGAAARDGGGGLLTPGMGTTADKKKTTRCCRCCGFLKTTGNNAAGTTACLNCAFSSLCAAGVST